MKLEATLYAAKDLPKRNPRARQIPYAVLQIDGMEGDIRTAAVKSSRAPEWNETFELEGISADELDITISVMDKDRVISSVSFSLSDVAAGQEIDQWVELQTEDEKEKGELQELVIQSFEALGGKANQQGVVDVNKLQEIFQFFELDLEPEDFLARANLDFTSTILYEDYLQIFTLTGTSQPGGNI